MKRLRNRLSDYLLMAASRVEGEHLELPRTGRLSGRAAEDRYLADKYPGLDIDAPVVVETLGEAHLSMMLAEALLLMSGDVHDEGDCASLDFTPQDAVVLVEAHGSLRAAELATGISRSMLSRAVVAARRAAR